MRWVENRMRRLERLGLGQALVAWGLHECSGSGRWVAQLVAMGRPVAPECALENLLLARGGLIAPLLSAEPVETWRIELEPADIPNLHTLEHPLGAHAQAMTVADGRDGDYVRSLVSTGKVDGAMLATANAGDDRIFFIDGLHRVWAWAELVRHGRGGSIQASLVITERMSWWAEHAASRQQ